MHQEKSRISYYVVSPLAVGFLSFVSFVLLGTFYSALNHSVGLNIFIWSVSIIIAYFIHYGFCWLLYRIFKKLRKPILINGWALMSGFITITAICLFNSSSFDDYLYVEVMGGLSGVIAFFQILYSISLHRQKRKEKHENK